MFINITSNKINILSLRLTIYMIQMSPVVNFVKKREKKNPLCDGNHYPIDC